MRAYLCACVRACVQITKSQTSADELRGALGLRRHIIIGA